MASRANYFLSSRCSLLRLGFSRASYQVSRNSLRYSSTETASIEEILSKPTWSVRSLLPSESQASSEPTVSKTQLHHLLRLSALPVPDSPTEEVRMLNTLCSQLHFVNEIQQVDISGVKALRALRDETPVADLEVEVSLDKLKSALAQEETLGNHHKRIRRMEGIPVDTKESEAWDILGHAQCTIGKHFVVQGGKE